MCWLQQSAELWHYPTFLLFPLLLVGGIECFAGYYAWRFLLGLNGVVLGLIGGVTLCVIMGATLPVLIGALAGAVVGGALFVAVTPLGDSVIAFSSVASFVISLGRIAGIPPGWYLPLAGAFGTIGSIAALTLRRRMIIILAAFAGAQQVSSAWTAYHLPADSIPPADSVIPSEWTLFLVLAGAGLVIQFATTRQIRRTS